MQIKYSNQEVIKDAMSLRDLILTNNPGIIKVKPRVLLSLIEKKYKNPVKINFQLPSSEIGSITTLEGAMLVALIKLLNPEKIFEFGTYLGYTTSLLLENSNAHVYSIDLPGEKSDFFKDDFFDRNIILQNDEYNDKFLTARAVSTGPYYLKFSIENSKLHLIKQNSLNFIPASFQLEKQTDFIFIDGGHTLAIITSDTNQSLKMISERGLIAWHDFSSALHTKVSEFLINFSRSNQILHIESTMLALGGPGLKQFFGKVLE